MKKLILIFMMVVMGFGCNKDITTKEYREKIGLPYPNTSILTIDESSVEYRIVKKNPNVEVIYLVLRDNSLTEDLALSMADSLVKNGYHYHGDRMFSKPNHNLLFGMEQIKGTDKKMITSTLVSPLALKTLGEEYFYFLGDKTTQKIGKYLLDVEKLQK